MVFAYDSPERVTADVTDEDARHTLSRVARAMSSVADPGDDAEVLDDRRRVVILFKATGDAPIIKRNKVRVLASAPFADVVAHLSKVLKIPAFAYLGCAFVPEYVISVGALCDAYGDGSKLVVFYATTPAWG